jgi:hypothetical protein
LITDVTNYRENREDENEFEAARAALSVFEKLLLAARVVHLDCFSGCILFAGTPLRRSL